ncbi:MAG: hypothetical protein Q9206_002939 [Seirophora lacunosa]
MKLLYTSSLALVLGYAFAAPSGLESREPSNEPINYPHPFNNYENLAFPDGCPADGNLSEFPLVSPPPYDGGKNNVKQGDERVVYHYVSGDESYDGNSNVQYCGIMTHVGAPSGGFILC